MAKRESDKNDIKIPKEIVKSIKLIELSSKILATDTISGGYTSVFRGYGMEFEEVREYFPGDDFRRIDWNVTARNDIPYIKRFKEERQITVMLLIDSSGSLEYGSKSNTKNRLVAEFASLISFVALSSQDKIGSLFFTNKIEKYIPPTKSRNSILRLIREIMVLSPTEKRTDINVALDFVLETMKKRGIIFILSDFYSDIDYKKLFIAKRKHTIVPVVFSDAFERNAIDVGLVDMVDNETGELRLVDTSSLEYKKRIAERERKRERFLKELKKIDIEPMEIDTDSKIERVIIENIKKRKKHHL